MIGDRMRQTTRRRSSVESRSGINPRRGRSALVAVASGEDVVNLEQEREERDTQEFKGLEGHVIESAGVGEMEDDGWVLDDPSWVADKEL